MILTNEEAIKELHTIRPRGGIIPQRRAEAIDLAVDALEKQIPKKYRDIGFEIQCGECGAVLPDLETYDYCPWCGQAIDWSEEE